MMFKKLIVIFYLFVIAFAVMPKTYFHDCHYQHESAVEKQHTSLEKVCQVCQLYFLQLYHLTDIGTQFITFLEVETPVFAEVKLAVTSTIVSSQTRGPPAGI